MEDRCGVRAWIGSFSFPLAVSFHVYTSGETFRWAFRSAAEMIVDVRLATNETFSQAFRFGFVCMAGQVSGATKKRDKKCAGQRGKRRW